MGYIYQISCDQSQKVYIGQTTQSIETRWRGHQQNAKRYLKYKDDPSQIKDIRFSCLYRAMAFYGIHTFRIEMVEEVNNDDLDDLEVAYISSLETRAPKGFNLTSGGSRYDHSPETLKLMKERKRELIDSMRNEKLRGLPAKTAYRNHPKRGEQIVFNNHDLCKYKTFSANTYGSFEKAKEAALLFITEQEAKGTTHVKHKRGEVDLLNKPGFMETPRGYRINKVHKGVVYDKRFERKDRTKEQNKEAASLWYDQLLQQLNIHL